MSAGEELQARRAEEALRRAKGASRRRWEDAFVETLKLERRLRLSRADRPGCWAANHGDLEREYTFAPPRRWRFDFAWPASKVAVEVDGGGWTQGRHARGRGIESDARKLSVAAALGWRVLRVTPEMIRSGEAARLVLIAHWPHHDLSEVLDELCDRPARRQQVRAAAERMASRGHARGGR